MSSMFRKLLLVFRNLPLILRYLSHKAFIILLKVAIFLYFKFFRKLLVYLIYLLTVLRFFPSLISSSFYTLLIHLYFIYTTSIKPFFTHESKLVSVPTIFK